MRPILFEFMRIFQERNQIKHSPKIYLLIRNRLYLTLYFYTLTACATIAIVCTELGSVYYPVTLLENRGHHIVVLLYYIHKISYILAPIICVSDAVLFLTLSTFVFQEVDYIKHICNSFHCNTDTICQKAIKNKLIELAKIHIQLKS